MQESDVGFFFSQQNSGDEVEVGNFFPVDAVRLPAGSSSPNQTVLADPTSVAEHVLLSAHFSSACAHMGRSCTEPGSAGDTRRNRQRRDRYAATKQEKLIVDKYKAAIASDDLQRADEILHTQLLSTRTGKKLFPNSSEAKTAVQVVANIANLNQSMGPRSKHRSHLLRRITEGIPAAFC